MTISDFLMIFAVLTGPVIAVRVTRFLDDIKEIRDRKLSIFKKLMATRAYMLSWDHIEALNRIDLEFDRQRKGEKAVIEAWKEYLDLLGNKSLSPEQWAVKRIDLLVELLHKMALVLKYDFDKTHIRNSSYSPLAHGELEEQQALIRRRIIQILDGSRPIPMFVTNLPVQEP